MADEIGNPNWTKSGMADDLINELAAACVCGPLDADGACLPCCARTEIERLRAVLDAERALADQLAVALLGTASGRIIPTDDEWAGVVKMRSAALDAWEARRG